MDAQLKKGVLEFCILHQCSTGDRYGYEIMKTIQSAFPDVYDGSVYAILRRLHAEGLTEVYFGEVSGGPRRKYYRITEEGRRYLEQSLQEWRALLQAIRSLGIH